MTTQSVYLAARFSRTSGVAAKAPSNNLQRFSDAMACLHELEPIDHEESDASDV